MATGEPGSCPFLLQHLHMVASILRVTLWSMMATREPAILNAFQVDDRGKNSLPNELPSFKETSRAFYTLLLLFHSVVWLEFSHMVKPAAREAGKCGSFYLGTIKGLHKIKVVLVIKRGIIVNYSK